MRFAHSSCLAAACIAVPFNSAILTLDGADNLAQTSCNQHLLLLHSVRSASPLALKQKLVESRRVAGLLAMTRRKAGQHLKPSSEKSIPSYLRATKSSRSTADPPDEWSHTLEHQLQPHNLCPSVFPLRLRPMNSGLQLSRICTHLPTMSTSLQTAVHTTQTAARLMTR